MQGLILFCALGGELLVRYRVRFVARAARRRRRRRPRMNNSIVVVVLASAVAYGTPLLYAALGELLAERSGVLNLGVEGMMLVGAVMGFWAVQRLPAARPASRSLAAIGVAALAGAAMALIHAFLVVTLRANQIVSGLALTIFAGAAGLSSYLGNDLEPRRRRRRGTQFSAVRRAGLARPARRRPDRVRADMRSSTRRGCCVVLVALYLRRTRPGLERPRGRRVAGGGRRDGDQRHRATATRTRSSAARSPASAARRSPSRSRRSGSTG